MKNILLLTDFSKECHKMQLTMHLQFFKGDEHNFFILNVHKTSRYTMGDLMTSSPTSSVYDSIIKNPKATLKKYIGDLRRNIC